LRSPKTTPTGERNRSPEGAQGNPLAGLKRQTGGVENGASDVGATKRRQWEIERFPSCNAAGRPEELVGAVPHTGQGRWCPVATVKPSRYREL
jgi:hypothetical protein